MDDFFAAMEATKRRKLVVLTKPEALKAVALVKGRNQKEAKFGAMTYDNRRGGAEAHLIGLFGEMGVAKLLGLPVDERIFEDSGDDGVDLFGDKKLGVKCTTYLNEPYLRVEIEHHNRELDGYVLCAMNKQKAHEIHVIGWATVPMVEAAVQKQFVPNGPNNYVLYEHELLDIATLKV